MDAAWFGLLGVVVGGFISSIWSWLAIVRQEQTDAMVAARLVDDDLDAVLTTNALGAAPSVGLWTENRVALAKVLGERDWRTIADVYRLGDRASGDRDLVASARDGLRQLVQGKRHVVPYRWRSLVRRRG